MKLSDRVEKLSGPDREVDAEIFIAAVWPDWRIQTNCGDFPEQVLPGRIQEPSGCGWRQAPAYTASLDAAMSLMPEGWQFTLRENHATMLHATSSGHDFGVNAATTTLALLAAILRARGL